MKNLPISLQKNTPLFFLSIMLFAAFFYFLTPARIFAQRDDGARLAPAMQIPDPVTLVAEQDRYPLGLHLQILEDKDGVWTIEDVTSTKISQQFVPSQVDVPNFGFTNSAYWVRFRVRDSADELARWLLAVEANLFFIDVYVPASNPLLFEVTRTGSSLPFNTREIDHPKFLFNLPLAPDEERTIYLRLESEGSMNLPLTIWSAEAVAQDDLVQQILKGFIYGVLLITVGYNLILFLYLRDRSYLYYVLFLFFLLLGFMVDDNFAHQYLWPNQGRFNAIGGQLFFVLAIMSALKFTTSFLSTKETVPRLHKAINILIIAFGSILPILLIDIGISARPVLILVAISYILIVTAGIITWRQGYHPARYFLLAWLLLLTSMVIFVISLFAFFPLGIFSAAGTQIGIVVLTLTLSLALADRITAFRQEAEAAQLEIVRNQQETIRLKDEFNITLQEINESLEERAEERARELTFAQAQIGTLFESSPLAIGTATLDGEILSVNLAMAQIFGYAEDELIGVNVTDFFLEQRQRKEIIKRLRSEKIVQSPAQQLKRKDGSLFYANVTESILERENQEVILGVVDDITDQIAAEQALKEKDEAAAVAAERNRIANELHDSVTQTLYTASLIAEALPKVWQKQPQEALRSLQELRLLTQGAQAEMRTLLLELRPGELADRKISELLRQLTDAMSARTELSITTTVIGNCELPTEVQIALYRIAQEALNNVSKHARASRAWVNLQCRPEKATLRIGDNGRGFDPDSSQPHQMGLRIMRERAEIIGAHLTVNSQPNQGTLITVVRHSSSDTP